MPEKDDRKSMVKSKTNWTGAAIMAVAAFGGLLLAPEHVDQIVTALIGLGMIFMRLGIDKQGQ